MASNSNNHNNHSQESQEMEVDLEFDFEALSSLTSLTGAERYRDDINAERSWLEKDKAEALPQDAGRQALDTIRRLRKVAEAAMKTGTNIQSLHKVLGNPTAVLLIKSIITTQATIAFLADEDDAGDLAENRVYRSLKRVDFGGIGLTVFKIEMLTVPCMCWKEGLRSDWTNKMLPAFGQPPLANGRKGYRRNARLLPEYMTTVIKAPPSHYRKTRQAGLDAWFDLVCLRIVCDSFCEKTSFQTTLCIEQGTSGSIAKKTRERLKDRVGKERNFTFNNNRGSWRNKHSSVQIAVHAEVGKWAMKNLQPPTDELPPHRQICKGIEKLASVVDDTMTEFEKDCCGKAPFEGRETTGWKLMAQSVRTRCFILELECFAEYIKLKVKWGQNE